MVRLLLRYREILYSTTAVELRRKYAGSFFGLFWLLLYPGLFLSIYLFLYLVVFEVRFPGMSDWGYVAFIFCGLVPYLCFMEAVTIGAVSVKQNIHLVKNVIVPIDLIAARVVLTAVVGQLAGLALLVVLLGVRGELSQNLVFLPVVVLFQFLFIVGLVWFLAALGVLLPDIGYFVNLFVIFLLFISPIGFRPEMLPERARIIVDANPVYYMLDAFRSTLMAEHTVDWQRLAIYALLSLITFQLGAAFFRRFKGVIVDYE